MSGRGVTIIRNGKSVLLDELTEGEVARGETALLSGLALSEASSFARAVRWK